MQINFHVTEYDHEHLCEFQALKQIDYLKKCGLKFKTASIAGDDAQFRIIKEKIKLTRIATNLGTQ